MDSTSATTIPPADNSSHELSSDGSVERADNSDKHDPEFHETLHDPDAIRERGQVFEELRAGVATQPHTDSGRASDTFGALAHEGPLASKLEQTRASRSSLPEDKASDILKAATDALAGLHPRAKAKHLVEQEHGQGLRASHRIPIQSDGLGLDRGSVMAEIDRFLGKDLDEVIILPSKANPALVGPSGYVDADRPNPFTWLRLLPAYARPSQVVWEMGATTWPSSEAAARFHGMAWALPRFQAGEHAKIAVRESYTPGWIDGIDVHQPNVVLVPLPMPVDAWSRHQHRRLWDHEVFRVASPDGRQVIKTNTIWDHQVKDNSVYPEFAEDAHGYLKAVKLRLQAINHAVPTGTMVIITIRERLGLPRAIFLYARERLGWIPVAQHIVLEEGSNRSPGDGTPLNPLSVSIWRVNR